MLKGRSLSSQKVCRDRTPKAWQSGKRRPSKVNLERIGTAYRTVRRQNVAAPLLRRLNAGGGTRVEIHPHRPQSRRRAGPARSQFLRALHRRRTRRRFRRAGRRSAVRLPGR